MTQNEQEMVIELAQAVNTLGMILEGIIPQIGDAEKRLTATDNLEQVKRSLKEVIRLIDAEWLSK